MPGMGPHDTGVFFFGLSADPCVRDCRQIRGGARARSVVNGMTRFVEKWRDVQVIRAYFAFGNKAGRDGCDR